MEGTVETVLRTMPSIIGMSLGRFEGVCDPLACFGRWRER
jgi:hypothetical protein